MSTAYTLYKQGKYTRYELISRLLEHYETIQTQLADIQAQSATVLAELAAVQSEPSYNEVALGELCEDLDGKGLGWVAVLIAACKRGEGQV